MQFHLVDKIESIEPGKRIVTVKALSLAEEYLADHFPAFPVMPGVLMIESMVQAAAWLVRVEQDFANSVIVLAGARNVRFRQFVQPGQTLRADVQTVNIDPHGGTFKANASVADQAAVSASLELRSFALTDRAAYLADADKAIVEQTKKRFELIGGPAALAAAGETA